MSSNKIFLMYNRKRLSSRSGLASKNGDPPPSDEHALEDQKGHLTMCMECDVSGVRDNLLQCADCRQSYHIQCLDGAVQNIDSGKRICCDCIRQQDSSTSHPIESSSRLKRKKHIEGSDAFQKTVRTQKTLVENPGVGTSGKDTDESSSMDISFEDKSTGFQNVSYANAKYCSACDDGPSDRRLLSQSMEIEMAKSSNIVDSKSADESKSSSHCDDNPSLFKTSNLGIFKASFTDISGDSLVQTKSPTSLITFSRRNKRKKNLDGADAHKYSFSEEKNCSVLTGWSNSPHINTSSFEAISYKGCSIEHLTDFKLPGGDPERGDIFCQSQQSMKDVESRCSHAEPASKTKTLINENRQSHDAKNVSKDKSHVTGQVPYQSSRVALDAQETSLDDAVKNSASNGAILDVKLEEHEFQEHSRDESHALLEGGVEATMVPISTREELPPCLNLSVTTPDSNTAPDCTTDIKSNSQKKPFHSAPVDSLDSSSRSRTSISHEVSRSESTEAINERVTFVHHANVVGNKSMLVDDVDSNCGMSFTGCSVFTDLKTKCLQLFSEDKSNDVSHLAIAKTEPTTYMVSGKRNTFQLGSENNQLKQISSGPAVFLGLSLPVELKFEECATNKFSTSLPLLKSTGEYKDFIQEGLKKLPFNQTSHLTHKLVLDRIMNQARPLNERVGFQDQLKSHPSIWSEEELDFLWVGVRRHGRGKWDAILRDPRLRFSPWRVDWELAERWEEEEYKLLNGTCASQSKHSKPQGVSLDCKDGFIPPKRRAWREHAMDKTRLSLGDVYACRAGNVSKRAHFDFTTINDNGAGQLQIPTIYPRNAPCSDFHGEICNWESCNYMGSETVSGSDLLIDNAFSSSTANTNFPHWLREAVTTQPLRPVVSTLSSIVPSIAQIGIQQVIQPNLDLSSKDVGPGNRIHNENTHLRSRGLQPSSDIHPYNFSPGVSLGVGRRGGTSLHHANTLDDLIIIDIEASSEETVSDDHTTSPYLR